MQALLSPESLHFRLVAVGTGPLTHLLGSVTCTMADAWGWDKSLRASAIGISRTL